MKMKGSRILRIAFLSIILLSAIRNSDAFCNYDDDYPHSQTIYKCSNMNAEELPIIVNIFLDTNPLYLKNLLLFNNNISTIGNSLFTSSNSKRLKTLTITNCEIEFISIGSFEILTDLENLEISDNKLTTFDGVVLEGLTGLKKLHLKRNKLQSIGNICSAATNLEEFIVEDNQGEIRNIQSNIFKDCSNLESLAITNAGIINIDAGFANSLSKLTILNLTGNHLNNLNFLKSDNTSRIESLDLSNNQITEVEAELLQVSLNKLRVLNLNGNQISVFMKGTDVSFTHQLKSLYLDSNNISVIDKDFLKYFNSINLLHIDYNPIEIMESGAFKHGSINDFKIKHSLQKWNHLKKGMFDGLSSLVTLDLSDINIVSIEKETFKDLNYLQNLYLQNNKIAELQNGTFIGLQKVNTFNLTNNPISSVEPGAFFGLKSLSTLEPKLFFTGVNRIQTRQFQGMSYNYLDYLDLSNLDILFVYESAFEGLFGLHKLRLDGNKIDSLVENTFIGVDYLQTLNISNNNIATVHKNAFAKLSKLSVLDLSSNQISVLHQDTFNSFLELSTLDLSNNLLTTLEPGAFRRMMSLRYLILNENMITHLKTHAFSGLTGIYEVHLDGNHIQKVDSGAFLGLEKLSKHFSSVLKSVLETQTLETDIFVGLSNLEYLDLSNKNITRINSMAFRGTILGEILLNNCGISVLSPKAFAVKYEYDKFEVGYVNLADNKLTYLDSDIFEFSKIKYLNLSGNVLQNVSFGTFAPITSLKKLFLNSASIENITNSGYYGDKNELELIDLSDNSISILESNLFEGMTKLKSLNLVNNPIISIQNLAFYGVSNLQDLSISVKISELTNRHLQGLELVHNITIINSKIHVIGTEAFSGLNLTKLIINNNYIDIINKEAFSKLPFLKLLDLSNNNLTYMQSNTLVLVPKLNTLDLSNNYLKEVECSLFSELSNVTNLYLNNNLIDKLKGCSFKQFEKLENLDLSFNNLHQDFISPDPMEKATFSPLNNLKSVNMSYNQLTNINSYHLFHLKDAHILDLSNNSIQMQDFRDFQIGNWNQLEIRNNAWECVNLLNLLKLLNDKDIKYSVEVTNADDNKENVGGISCK